MGWAAECITFAELWVGVARIAATTAAIDCVQKSEVEPLHAAAVAEKCTLNQQTTGKPSLTRLNFMMSKMCRLRAIQVVKINSGLA